LEENKKKYMELLAKKDNPEFKDQLELLKRKIFDRLANPDELHTIVKSKLELQKKILMKQIEV
jgi:hypothetical protein